MLYFIVNPSASSGKGKKIWEKAKELLDQKKVPYRCLMLKGPGEAKKEALRISDAIAAKEKEGAGTPVLPVTVVGGDGTINEFLNGLTAFRGIHFSYLPTGSGNDFARGLEISSDPAVLIDHLTGSPKTRMIDVGSISEPDKDITGAFAVSSGFGFDAAACYGASRSRLKAVLNRIKLGKLVYAVTAVRLLFSMTPLNITLTMDDADPLQFEKTYFAAAMNTKYEGGGFKFCPEADPSDGQLDIIVAEGLPKWKVLMSMPSALSGKHVNTKGIHIYRCKKAVLTSDREAHVHMDGEHFGFCSHICWSIKKDQLTLVP